MDASRTGKLSPSGILLMVVSTIYRFQERAGSCVVEAMLSRSAPVFYGDLRSHERVPLPFSTFITSCKRLQNSDDGCGVCVGPEGGGLTEPSLDEACLPSVDSPHQVYLAQVPILNIENRERSQLETLREDIQMPKILKTKALTSINLWMNNAKSRSSTHYDPDHNLLCVVAGCKRVVLWPPSAIPSLYPMPIYSEASNHSSVDLENPDFSTHPRAKNSIVYSQKVILHAGDALFIPEGWSHQVDSDDLTIAVNFWWRSSIMSCIPEHTDAYYLRIILRRLVNTEMDQMLHWTSIGSGKSGEDASSQLADGQGHHERDLEEQSGNKELQGTDHKHEIMLHQMDPVPLQALHQLVSLVHDGVSIAGQNEQLQSTSTDGTVLNVKGECNKNVASNSFCLEDDQIAKVIWTLEPLQLQNVLLAMVHNFPRTLEALILHMLSPVAAEVLTRKFDEIDQQTRKEDRDEFYLAVYGVFDDQFAAMNSVLNGKESFARQAFKNVLDKYMGVNFEGQKL
ncbi:JmjC domain [Macleaya cordata]|uniref:JmjC domain n=1 Tax=Macleaya cordata TaxID=56857 RepID=A0A200Q4I8_MACCD|nr:JmjC domain [Macleaya cordata]